MHWVISLIHWIAQTNKSNADWYAKKYEGKGFMTEALEVTLQYMFDVVGLNRVMATYMPRNKASEKVLFKLGFEKEGYARKYLKIAGKWEDHILTSRISDN